jgi:hypothetical protein
MTPFYRLCNTGIGEGVRLLSCPIIEICKVIGLQPHYGPGVDSASNRNEYQEYSGGKGRPARKADNLTAIYEPIV